MSIPQPEEQSVSDRPELNATSFVALQARVEELERELQQCQLELHQAQAAQHATDTQLRDILDSAIAALICCRLYTPDQWDYNYYSQSSTIVFGYTPQDLLADKTLWRSRVFPADWEAILVPAIHRLLVEHQTITEYRFWHKDGSLRWIRETAVVRWDEAAACWVMTALATDISDRKAAEEALRQYERVVSETPDAVGLIDRTYTYRLVNQTYLHWFQRTQEAIVGHTVADLTGEDRFHRVVKPHFDRCLAGEIVRFEEWLTCPDGDRRFLSITYAPYYVSPIENLEWSSAPLHVLSDPAEPEAMISGVIVTKHDLTNLKRAEEALAESETFLRSIYDNTQISLFIADVLDDGNFHYVGQNPIQEQLTGITTGQLRNKTPEQIFPPDIAAQIRQHYQTCVETGSSISYDEYVPFQNQDFWWITTLTPLLDHQGRIYRLVGSCLNVTERVQAEREREQQRQKSQLISELTVKIRQSIDLNAILQTTVDEVQPILQADRVVIYRFSADWSGTFITEAVSATELSILEQTIHDPCFEERYITLYQQGRVNSIPDILQAPIQDCHKELLQQFAVRANLVVPLLQDQHLWGLLIIHQCTAPRNWTDDEIEFLRQLASQVSLAIQQANLYQQLHQELTDRQRAEAALQRLNQDLEQKVQQRTTQLKLAISAANFGIWEWDIVTNTEYWSPENYRLLGYQRDAEGRVLEADGTVVGLYPTFELFFNRLSADDQERLRQNQQRWFAAQDVEAQMEYRLTLPDGSDRWLLVRSRVFYENGRPVKQVGVSLDITDRKQAEEELRHLAEQEQLLTITGQHIRQSLNLNEILIAAVTDVRTTFQADRALIFHLTSTRAGVVLQESVLPEYPITEAMCWQDECFPPDCYDSYLQGTPQIVMDIATDDWGNCLVDFMQEARVRSKIVAPIVQPTENGKSQVWGLLIVHACAYQRQWQPADANFLQRIADQLAIAIQQSERYQQLQTELNKRKQVEEQLRASLQEKEVLLREIHHRVKNNLQVVSSLLNLQSSSIQDSQILQPFIESQHRIQVMAMIHERLYRSRNLAQLNFAEYVQGLVEDLFQSCLSVASTVHWRVEVAAIDLDVDIAIPCGLIINELVSNAIKYAFPDGRPGEISIIFELNHGQFTLSVSDNGIGFPLDIDFRATDSLGLQVVCALTRQLDGAIALDATNGTAFTITFSNSIVSSASS